MGFNESLQFYKNNQVKLNLQEKIFIKNNILQISSSKDWKPINFQSLLD
jgi:hypothetical protein